MKQIAQQFISTLLSTKGLCVIVVITALLTSCTTRQRFDKSLTVKTSLAYQINKTGTVYEYAYFDPKELSDKLKGNNTYVTKISLTSMSIKIDKNSGNTAPNFRLLTLSSDVSGKDNILNPQNLAMDKTGESVLNTLFTTDGVAKLNKILSDQLVGQTNIHPAYKRVGFYLNGESVPATSAVSITLTITMDCNIEYSSCEEVPSLLFGDSTKDCY